MVDDEQETGEAPPSAGYEVRDADPRVPIWVGLGVVGLMMLALAALSLPFVLGPGNPYADVQPQGFFSQPQRTRATAPLLVAPAEHYRALTSRQEARLASYGWLDREHRRAHIPIERAMQLYVQRRNNASARDNPSADKRP